MPSPALSPVLLRLTGAGDGADAWRPVPAAAPLLPASAAATGSDGVFETISVIDGTPRALPAHLERLAASAARCGIPVPVPHVWAEGVALAAAALGAARALSITTVLLGGHDHPTSVPAAWVSARVAPDAVPVRTTGVRVAVLDRGVPFASPAPWLRLDAKTLSYAVAGAAMRETHRRGADEVVFRSSDGFLLEGATASILLRTGDLLQTPAPGPGVLAGTTVARLLAFGRSRGLRAVSVPLPAETLERADAAWLASSVRGVVPITAVDGVPLQAHPELSAAFNRALAGPPARSNAAGSPAD